MTSLIQQRQELTRRRRNSVGFLVLGALWPLLSVLQLVTAEDLVQQSPFVVGYFLVGVVWLIVGIPAHRKVRADIARFEAEHGPDAGEQTPVT